MELKIELGLDGLASLMNFLASQRNSLSYAKSTDQRTEFAKLCEVQRSGSKGGVFDVTLDLCEGYSVQKHPYNERERGSHVWVGAAQLLDLFQTIKRFPES